MLADPHSGLLYLALGTQASLILEKGIYCIIRPSCILQQQNSFRKHEVRTVESTEYRTMLFGSHKRNLLPFLRLIRRNIRPDYFFFCDVGFLDWLWVYLTLLGGLTSHRVTSLLQIIPLRV